MPSNKFQKLEELGFRITMAFMMIVIPLAVMTILAKIISLIIK